MSEERRQELADSLRKVRERIDRACHEAGRSPEEVELLAVTKTFPATDVALLSDLGLTEFAENRHQEAQAKAAELADLALTWHFVGQLQSKKARQVRRYAHVVQSLDRDSVVDAFAPTESEPDPPVIDGFVQVNLTDDPDRGGVQPADVDAMVERVDGGALPAGVVPGCLVERDGRHGALHPPAGTCRTIRVGSVTCVTEAHRLTGRPRRARSRPFAAPRARAITWRAGLAQVRWP